MAPYSLLRTLDRALWILTFFKPGHLEWGVTELAEELGLPKSVVQKTLATFARRGFLHQDPDTRRYRLGLRLLSLAQSVAREQEVARLAHPYLTSLAERTGETAKLSVEDGGESVILAVVESKHSMRMTSRVGDRYPLYAGASNKVLAAYMPWSRLQSAINGQEAQSLPQQPMDDFQEQLRAIVSQGYAVSTGENESGVTAVSAPVWDANGGVAASLSVLGPASRLPQADRVRMIDTLLETANAISKEMGYEGASERRDAG